MITEVDCMSITSVIRKNRTGDRGAGRARHRNQNQSNHEPEEA